MAATDTALQEKMHDLYCEHQGWLFGWLRRKLGCAHQAADLTQDTFVRIIASRDALLAMREPRAYLTTTAKRLLVDQARHQLIETAYLEALQAFALHSDSSPSPERILQTVQALVEIDAVLERLSANARQAFLLHYLDGLTHAAIANQLGVSTRMIQKYLVQALAHCTHSLDY
ncbi:sigma-70 family RNA polymerase sigma factor [uncultured Oxalicibacterium sp.]|uniref:sigma-70 family RNA polymerase sigma factor n=1 Tax=uncultured Oxalicibacterium sp. TaxID=1168540 RepID=UPI0025E5E031|nr:sigma-70 family RNA polymerase sigma factor [uncultured Oxalicibacterium sp.]